MIGTAANGCTNLDSVTVTVHPLPPANAGPDVSICEGDSVQLQATGGVSYQWTPASGLSNPLIPNPIVQPGTSTNYNVQVTDTNGCIGRDSVNVLVYASPSKPMITLSNDTLFVIGGYAGYQWIFNGVPVASATDTFFVVSQMGEYAVEVTNDDGCTSKSDERFVDPTGIHLLKDVAQIKVYPNPASNTLWVQIESKELLKPTIRLLAINGASIWEETRASQFHHLVAIPIDHLAKGLYLLEIRTLEGNTWQRVVVE